MEPAWIFACGARTLTRFDGMRKRSFALQLQIEAAAEREHRASSWASL